MGETEGKKDEADYKRLQTFPLVRVSPKAGSPREEVLCIPCRTASREGKGSAHSHLNIKEATVIHLLIHPFIHHICVLATCPVQSPVLDPVERVANKAGDSLAHVKGCLEDTAAGHKC